MGSFDGGKGVTAARQRRRRLLPVVLCGLVALVILHWTMWQPGRVMMVPNPPPTVPLLEPSRAVEAHADASSMPAKVVDTGQLLKTNDATATAKQTQAAASKVLRMQFEMSSDFRKAWAKSSDRLSFPSKITLSGHTQAPDSIDVLVTLYGKSSIKIKYTVRRSVQIDVVDPRWLDPGTRHRLWPGAPFIKSFVLLSLWEDTYRIAYRASALLLGNADLFYSAHRYVSLSWVKTEDADGPAETLGAYMLIEYPSDAIARRINAAHDEGFAPVCSTDLVRKSAFEPSALRDGAALEIGTRNWFYYEKPSNYDLLHVPSYKRNSSLSETYRLIEHDPIGGASAKAVRQAFDIDRYLSWLAINHLLQNGDYDDEVFFFRSGQLVSIMAWDYDNVFAACHRDGARALRTDLMFCAETPIEKKVLSTPKLLAAYMENAVCLMNGVASVKGWQAAVNTAVSELQAVFEDGGPSVVAATFAEKGKKHVAPRDVTKGGAELVAKYADRWSKFKSAMPDDAQRLLKVGAANAEEKRTAAAATSVRKDAAGSDAGDPANGGGGGGVCDAAVLSSITKRLSNALKPEYKGVATWDSATVLPMEADKNWPAPPVFKLYGPSGAVTLPTTAPVTEAGAYCGLVVFRDCRATRVSVLRSKERGKAEFGVGHFSPVSLGDLPFTSPTDVKLNMGGIAVVSSTGSYWPADLPAIFLVRLLSVDKKHWVRLNAVLTVKDGAGAATDVAVVRGYSAVLGAPSSTAEAVEAAVGKRVSFALPRKATQDLTFAFDDVETTTAWRRWPSWDTVKATAQELGGSSVRSSRRIERRAGAEKKGSAEAPCVLWIKTDLRIEPHASLTIGAGCSVVLDRAVTVTVEGTLRLDGTPGKPVNIVPTRGGEENRWDSIVVTGSGASLSMSHSYVTGSGAGAPMPDKTGKHHSVAAAITAVDGAHVTVTASAIVYLGKSSAFAMGTRASVTVSDSVVQFAHQGAECVDCDFTSISSVWSHFATQPSAAYEDNDDDALYLSGGTHRVLNSVIANTHDDGIDTGTPEKASGDGGSIHVDNCIIEAIAHEGIALSSSPKATRVAQVANSLIQNCQQAVEVGYTGEGHVATVTNSLIRKSAVGVRYGDNYYNRPVAGHIKVQRSVLSDNGHDYFNYVRQLSRPKASSYIIMEETLLLSALRPVDDWPCVETGSSFTKGRDVTNVAAPGVVAARIATMGAMLVPLTESETGTASG